MSVCVKLVIHLFQSNFQAVPVGNVLSLKSVIKVLWKEFNYIQRSSTKRKNDVSDNVNFLQEVMSKIVAYDVFVEEAQYK